MLSTTTYLGTKRIKSSYPKADQYSIRNVVKKNTMPNPTNRAVSKSNNRSSIPSINLKNKAMHVNLAFNTEQQKQNNNQINKEDSIEYEDVDTLPVFKVESRNFYDPDKVSLPN